MKVMRKCNRTIVTPEMIRIIEQKVRNGNFLAIELLNFIKSNPNEYKRI